jgi:hypothetical protein
LPRSAKRQSQGAALITVLWLVLLLTLLGACVLVAACRDRATAREQVRSAERQGRMEGALALTLQRLADQDTSRAGALRIPTQDSWVIGWHTLNVVVEDEAARIDLNTADAAWITALLVSSGVDESRARKELARLRAWDRNHSERASAHAVSSPDERTPTGSLQRVDEAIRLGPLWRWLVQCHQELLTVYSNNGAPTLSNPPKALTALVKWANEHTWDNYAWPEIQNQTPVSQASQSLAGRVVHVTISETEPAFVDSPRYEAVVRLTGNPSSPVLMYFSQDKQRLTQSDCDSAPKSE